MPSSNIHYRPAPPSPDPAFGALGEHPDESRARAFFRTRVILPFVVALRAGTSPDGLAMSITMAIVFGLFPVLGITSILCFLTAWRFGLNTPIMQAINLVLTPLDVALSLPFMRIGEKILGRDELPLSPSELIAYLKEVGFAAAIGTLLQGLGCAIVGWMFVMAPAGVALYYLLRPLLKIVMKRRQAAAELDDPLLPLRSSQERLIPARPLVDDNDDRGVSSNLR
ncbi:hypothetical protein HDU86_007457 [Geranomyces michiganensis]|nr:hypothetical protein HDU86_007457 [Geranomyces michiganensis]